MAFLDDAFINIANLIGGTVSIIVSIIIIQKNFRVLLNQLLGGGVFFWGLSLLFNAITFVLEHNLTAARIIRNFTTSFAVIAAFLIFSSAISMFHGEYFLKKWYILGPLIIALVVNIVIVSIYDYVVLDNGQLKTTQKETWVLIFVYLIPLLMICWGLYYFIRTRMEVEDPIIKDRILFFVLGSCLIILGAIVYALEGVLETPLGFSRAIEYVFWVFAEFFWLLGPILMLIGFYIGTFGKKAIPEEAIPPS